MQIGAEDDVRAGSFSAFSPASLSPSEANPDARAEIEAQMLSEFEDAVAALTALDGRDNIPAPGKSRSRLPVELIVAPWSGLAAVLRRMFPHATVVDMGGAFWGISDNWVDFSARQGSAWVRPECAPLGAAATVAAQRVAQAIRMGQRVLIWNDEASAALVFWLQFQGVASDALAAQIVVAPKGLSPTRMLLQAWGRLGFPGEPLPVDQFVTRGRLHWASIVYEEALHWCLQQRITRERVKVAVPPRALLNMMLWIDTNTDAALHAVFVDRPTNDLVGVIRCPETVAQIVSGGAWSVVSAEEMVVGEDPQWVSFLFGKTAEAESVLAGSGWMKEAKPGDQVTPELRSEVLQNTTLAEMHAVLVGFLKEAWSGRLGFGYHVQSGTIYNGAKATTVCDLAEASGATGEVFQAVCARLAFHHVHATGKRTIAGLRRVKMKVSRKAGSGPFGMQEIVVHLGPRSSNITDFTGREIFIARAQPIDRRHRDIAASLERIDDALIGEKRGRAAALMGLGASGLLTIGPSVRLTAQGQTTADFFNSRWGHLFLPQYARWVEARLREGRNSLGEQQRALGEVMADFLGAVG